MNRREAMKLRKAIVQGSESLPDEMAHEVPFLFDVWVPGEHYTTGERRRYTDTLYKCIQEHTSQPDWTPDVAVSLWVRVDDPGEEWPEWVQPTGAHDSYAIGAKVSHIGHHWTSEIDYNVYEPSVYGWNDNGEA